MASNDIQEIKNRLDILDVIGDRVRLHRAGRSYVGLCPFHNEKTPSFHVNPEKQTYHCFGCGKGGDLFSFVMEAEGVDFPQALELLAARAGVTLTKGSGRKKTAGQGSPYEVLDLAAKFFVSQLRGPEGAAGRVYMERRALTGRDALRFGLGWSASSWDSLWRYLKGTGVTERQALDAGLVIENQRGGVYDRFRGRLMFPIRDIAGRVIAFGGRLVDGDGAKYINSPEGDVYSKRRNLYLLNEARGSIREKGRSILVEGYMDALRLHLGGFTEAVASLGTSLTEDQARLLKRFGDQCFICYDSDTAGQEATLRGMYILQGMGLDVRVISLPSGKDPDELLCSEGGRELFEGAIQKARPLLLQHLFAVRGLLDAPETRKRGVTSLMEGLIQLDPSAVSPYAQELAGALGLYPHEFWRELEAFRRSSAGRRRETAARNAPEAPRGQEERLILDPLEAALCSLLWRDKKSRHARPEEVLGLLTDERVKEVALAILMESPETLEARWLSLGDRWPLALISRGDSFCDELTGSGSEPWTAVREGLMRRKKEARLRELNERMKLGSATAGELTELRTLTAELKRAAG
ncbi:MAG: DNA primase [Synergistaceae bacterium]|nr:DNA primase [Synergistaceae bacterium]